MFLKNTPSSGVMILINHTRTWRTREDPFADIWSELRVQLELNPAQTAKDLLQDLQKRRPGRFRDGQLRTLQRRVREWRLQQLYWQDLLHREAFSQSAIGTRVVT
jgi:hypothetical protein